MKKESLKLLLLVSMLILGFSGCGGSGGSEVSGGSGGSGGSGASKDVYKILDYLPKGASNVWIKKSTTEVSSENYSKFSKYSQRVNNIEYEFDPQWLVDADISYKVTKNTKIALGGTNIFNSTPSKWSDLEGTFYGKNGIYPYSGYSPTGYSGAFYYLRASMEF